MVSAADFTIFVAVMFWCAVGIFGVAMALMVALLGVRLRAIAHRRRTDYLVTLWRGIFTGAQPNRPMHVRRGDAFTILNLWADFQRVRTQSRGVSAQHLHEVAAAQRFDLLASRLLAKGDAGDQLVALTFMGYFPVPASRAGIEASTQSPFSELALAAYRALVAIDAATMALLAQAITERDDFRPRTLERILSDIGPATATAPMIATARSTSGERRARLLRYFPLLEKAAAGDALRQLLDEDPNPSVIAAALRALTPVVSGEDRPLVRRFLEHELAFVRIAAIAALVPVCEPEDRESLMRLLSDRDSWVRYRAAQVLVQFYTDDGTQGDLRREVADRYARDALTQVLAERSVVELRQFIADEVGEESHAPAEGNSRAPGTERRPIGEMRPA